MVDVTELGGAVAVRESAGYVAAPHERVQRRRWAVSRLRCDVVAGVAHLPELRTTSNQLGQQRRGYRATTGDQRSGTVIG
jgi:hypothetical protein